MKTQAGNLPQDILDSLKSTSLPCYEWITVDLGRAFHLVSRSSKIFFFFLFLKAGSLYIAQAQALRFPCFSLPSAGITDVHHHTQPSRTFLVPILLKIF
jgi:hypothetical protein